jgi:hypothetical protein
MLGKNKMVLSAILTRNGDISKASAKEINA